eukprot:TRINITY_DN18636_c0_g1_i1.p2 TRINITY_DN18636_c0_g1~~TRINITY_DN18636_c0_g1_i1.p2  ORF type:complete len:232 (+),score=20.29 TRINITY_DN18636_c0_g1_i1:76-771(+)
MALPFPRFVIYYVVLAFVCGVYQLALKAPARYILLDTGSVLAILLFDYFFHNPFCSYLFRCGCGLAWSWKDGWADCNVHNHTGPRCPWCICAEYLGGWSCLFVNDVIVLAIVVTCGWLATGRPKVLADFVAGLRQCLPGCLPCGPRAYQRSTSADNISQGDEKPVGKTFLLSFSTAISAWVLYNFLIGVSFFLLTDYPFFLMVNRGGDLVHDTHRHPHDSAAMDLVDAAER